MKAAPPFSTLQIPDRHIVLPCIVMKHPLNIVGTPGTIVEIINGNIVADFRDFYKNNPQYSKVKGCISEVSIIFKLDIHKI